MGQKTLGQRISVRSLEFHGKPFRKLSNIKLNFAERINLIAGHNGIGKSTILGLVANTFGMASEKSYFNEPFSANIERIVFISVEEIGNSQLTPSDEPVVTAQVVEALLRKRCSLTPRTRWNRVRVVPRTIEPNLSDPTGPDAKLPLPTIYLGMKRLASIGEAQDREVSTIASTMDQLDKDLYVRFFNEVILNINANDKITHQNVKGSRKSSAQPGYSYDARAISVGQDSLGSIATAIASFNRLKRVLGDSYPGGLLVIDELDVGFHPHAIGRLVAALKRYAKALNLQVIATTHSPVLIAALHPESGGNNKSPDAVFYLVDTRFPRLAEDQSLDAILQNMSLEFAIPARIPNPTVFAYFEDAEAKEFFEAILPSVERGRIARRHGVKLTLIPLGIGGSNLVALPEKDPLFASRVLIVDADTKISDRAKVRGNAVKLPCGSDSPSGASPENTIKQFLRLIVDRPTGPYRRALDCLNTSNPTSDLIAAQFLDGSHDSDNRDASKSWWRAKFPKLKRLGVLTQWVILNAAEVESFRRSFEQAVASVASRLRAAR